MVRKVLFLLTALLAANSCIREKTDGCPANLSLVFELDDPYSTGDFDSDIGNDVEIQFFREDLYSGRTIIPYDQICSGSPYHFQKKCTDGLTIVAYALPPGQHATKPSPQVGERYYDQYLRMESFIRVYEYKPYGGSLYLGKVGIEGIPGNTTRYRIAMTPCFAKVIVLVVDAATSGAVFSQTPSVGIEGTAAAMRIHDGSISGAIEVRADLSNENNAYTTGLMHILPPETSGQNLKVNLYDGGDLLMYVETGQEAVAGKEIIIKIDPGNFTAEITIDGWTYKTQAVTP